jgi:hypothetical protein
LNAEPRAFGFAPVPLLIGGDKFQSTAVYDADENKIGSIERVMIGKQTSNVSYALLSFGVRLEYKPAEYKLLLDRGYGSSHLLNCGLNMLLLNAPVPGPMPDVVAFNLVSRGPFGFGQRHFP